MGKLRAPKHNWSHMMIISFIFYVVVIEENESLVSKIDVLASDNVSIHCYTKVPIDIQWHFNSISNLFYAGRRFYKYGDRLSMENDNAGTYILVIPKVRSEDAGWYNCSEEISGRRISSTHLTVLYSDPVCYSNMQTAGFIGPNTCNLEQENMVFNCIVSFNGTSPHLMWRLLNDNRTLSDSICEDGPNRRNCSLIMKSDPTYDGSILICQTTATTDSRFNCSTEVIKILYFSSTNDTAKKYVNDNVNCSTTGNLNVKYKWTLTQNNKVTVLSSNRNLVIQTPGIYNCEVNYNIRNYSCLSVVSVMNVSAETTNGGTTSGSTTLAITLSVVLGLLVLSIGIVILIRRRIKRNAKKINYRTENEALKTFLDQMGKQKFQPSEETPISTLNWKFVRKLQLKDSTKPIYGIAILNDELFSISQEDSKFEVYSMKEDFPHKRSCSVKGLTTPKDIISCRDKTCLFIKGCIKIDKNAGDNETSANIFRVSTTGHVKNKWKIHGDTGQISISGVFNVLVPSWDGSKLLEFTFNGKKVREIEISREAEIRYLRQALLIDYSYFLLIHGDNSSTEKHRVCALDLTGKLMKQFGDQPGSSLSQVDHPSQLVVGECNSIILADRKNKRLLLMSSKLELITPVQLEDIPNEPEVTPWRLCLNTGSGLLIVSDNVFDEYEGVMKESRIIVYSAAVESHSN